MLFMQMILSGCFYLLFAVTPLIFTSYNHELFEYNKMMFVYLMTILILGSWAIKMLRAGKIIFSRTPLDIPILGFLIANIISTITSIDMHTSIWGYYTRSNGGLLSTLAYLSLFYALVSNFNTSQIWRFIQASLFGGLLVALYAIPEHFGVSPSCVVIYGQFNVSCWVQDVQARVFATFGQPNWLAAYFGMLIFPVISLYLTAKDNWSRIYYYILILTYYLAFTFTFSRGGMLGVVGGIAVMLIGIAGLIKFRKIALPKTESSSGLIKAGLTVMGVLLVVNLVFGSAWTRFKLIAEAPQLPVSTAAATTQLETGGTESGQIRLIVWKGAWEIFKHYPLFGSGVETFAYAYYQFRPVEHNLVSEWDFLYNKAHNEYLNYLATTGLVGFVTYMAIIAMFGKVIWNHFRNMSKAPVEDHHHSINLMIIGLIAAYVSYLIQNIFGFSVVMIALLFYLIPAMVIVLTGQTRPIKFGKEFKTSKIFKRILYLVVTIFVAWLVFYGLLTLVRLWLADTNYAKGSNYSDSGNPGKGYNLIFNATELNPREPLYQIDLGYNAASAAVVSQQEDASLSATLKQIAITETEDVLTKHPKNISHYRTAIRTYYDLSSIDPEYNQKLVDIFDQAISLAPTDAKLLYNKGLILGQLQRIPEAIETLKRSVELKPNYRDAQYTLGILLKEVGEDQAALDQMEIVLKLIPNDVEAIEKIAEWKK